MKENRMDNSFCDHPMRINSLCAVCGAELLKQEGLVSALHKTDQLLLTQEEAIREHSKRNIKLKEQKKMILILDLDQTILHSNMRSEASAPLDGTNANEHYLTTSDFTFNLLSCTFYVKLRPYLHKFLKEIHRKYEIHIYTMGTRDYAKAICDHLDPKGKYFGDRIVSRTENFNILKKSIDRITSIHSNVVILDDRADVWDFCKNLILIKPFWYKNEIDINDPSKAPLYISEDKKLHNEAVAVSQALSTFDRVDIPECVLKGSQKIGEFQQGSDITTSESLPTSQPEEDIIITIPDTSKNNTKDNTAIGFIVECSKGGIEDMTNVIISELKATKNDEVFNVTETDNLMKDSPWKIANGRVKLPLRNGNNENTKNKNKDSTTEDRELIRVIKILKKVHHMHFKHNKTASEVLSIKSLERIRIAADPEYFPLIRMSGATFSLENPSLVINSFLLAEKYKLLNVSDRWLYACIYARRAITTQLFLLSDHRGGHDLQNDDKMFSFLDQDIL